MVRRSPRVRSRAARARSRSSAPGRRAVTTEPVVVQATVKDLDALVPLFDAYRRFYREASDPAACRAFLSERLAREESVVFLCRRAGSTLGFVQLYPTFSSTSVRRLWVLNDLYVVPTARRRGVGSLLLRRAQQLAKESGASGVTLETARDNPAQRLYEAHGWKRDRAFLHYEWNPP